MAYYAQIKNSIVKNVIRLDDTALEATFTTGFDLLVNLGETRESGQPGPGWSYDSEEETFSPPIEE
jgi:hypothetical protein